MELQDRQSYFRQVSAYGFGFGMGLIIPAIDYLHNATINSIATCVFGGAVLMALGMIGWIFMEKLIK